MRASVRRASFLLLLGASCAGVSFAAAAIGPLDALALHKQREQVTEAVHFANSVKVDVAEFFIINERWPKDATELGLAASSLAAPDKGVVSVRIEGGAIIATLGGKIDGALQGKVVATSPCLAEGAVLPQFVCGFAICPVGTRVVAGAPTNHSLTTLTNEQLPSSCRGHGNMIAVGLERAKAGDLTGRAHWGGSLIAGREFARDVPEGLRLVRDAAEARGALAQGMLGDYYALGIEGYLARDDVSAYYWYSLAAQAGTVPVAGALAQIEQRMTAEQIAQAKARLAGEAGASGD